jgi:hypothetical protein
MSGKPCAQGGRTNILSKCGVSTFSCTQQPISYKKTKGSRLPSLRTIKKCKKTK